MTDAWSRLLYPMLSEQPSAGAALIDELARAPLEKAAESARLRVALVEGHADEIVACAAAMARRIDRGGRVLGCGNGGSATSAADLVAELLGGHGVPALCLTNDVAVVTAVANDVSFDDVFARQVAALGRGDDVLVLVSTSGGSENLLRAAGEGRTRGMLTVGITGYDGGRMAREGALDHCFVVRSSSVHRIQEVQTTLYHLLVELVVSIREGRECA